MNPLIPPLLALGGACAAFAVVFIAARRIGNFGIVDVAWSAGFAPVAAFYAVVGGGAPLRRAAVALMAGAWSLRLAWHIARRVAAHHPGEDARYVQLRREWAGRLNSRMFWFFQLQAALLAALSAPFLLACRNPAPAPAALELAGAALFAAALAGEAAADAQLAAFKRDPRNRGRVCAAGLWAWTRHPNYFFEWLIWVSFALFALPSPHGWVALCCPALMLYFLLCVTGVPGTEEHLLRSKGEAYRAYQRATPAFFPRPPRPGPGSLSQ